MSNAIRYDSLLVHYLARELHDRLSGERITGVRIDPDSRVAAVELEAGALVCELHPTRGWIRFGPAPHAEAALPAHRRATIKGVTAPAGERLLVFDIASPGRSVRQVRRIVIELITNQWNFLALSRENRILDVLRPRTAGGRRLHRGREYAVPEKLERADRLSRDEFRELLEGAPPEERANRLVRSVMWVSPLNAPWVVAGGARSGGDAAHAAHAATGGEGEGEGGEAGGRGGLDAAIEGAFRRYDWLVSLPPAEPAILRVKGRPQPYPLRLSGLDARPAHSLMGAIAEVADAPPPEEAARPAVSPELRQRLERKIGRLGGRMRGLERELEGAAPEAARLRARANLLLSRLKEVRKGMDRVELTDFGGGTVEIELDPAISPAENADRLYEAAQKRERAAETLPKMIEAARSERARLVELRERVRSGEADDAEVEAAIGPARGAGGTDAEPERLPPYRRYRTSSGLEVRVGRNRQANDELTFHHSSPDDIWLHARDAAGSHVVLRWPDRDGNPPQRDLLEAAVLAAVHSRARTSGTVAVDWTRRKYVRKPRKAPAGRVVPDRVQTLFVEPDKRVERRLLEGE